MWSRRPDLVLADIMMPGLDGLGLLQAVRADPALRDLPVILLSARAGEESRIQGLQDGADDYLVKPFSGRELTARVAVHLELSRIRNASQEAVRESEARYRNLFNQAVDGIFVADATGRYSDVNPTGANMLGYTPEELRQLTLADVLAPEELPRLPGQFKELERGAIVRNEWRFRRKDGSTFPGELVGRRFADGRMLGIVCDITARVESEEALREADRRKDVFLATLAHELRNPLAPIKSGLQILQRGDADGATAGRVRDMMARQVDHLVRLVDDLLEVSRISRGQIELRKETIDLAQIVNDAVAAVQPLIAGFRHRLTVSLPPRSLILEADPTRIAQALINLMNNAAKFTAPGGRIDISAGEEDQQAVVSVQDNGAGIPEGELSRVFDLFTKIDRGTVHSQGGLGIGLALARSIVEMHGGRIEARSAGADQGSEFTIRLSLAKSSAVEIQTENASELEATAPTRRILVVDDNRDVADSLAMLLEALSPHVRVAYDGRTALELAAAFRPEVVFIDLGMPEMDGYETARRLRQLPNGHDFLLVALTGWGQEENRRRARNSGFDEHLTKPADLKHLEGASARGADKTSLSRR
jgi:PAS domain S-box-containing protein